METHKDSLTRQEQQFGQTQLIWVAVVGVAVSYSFTGTAQVLFADKIGATAGEIGLLTALLPLLVLVQFPLSWLVTKYGKRTLLLLGQFLGSVAVWLLFFVPYLYQKAGPRPAILATILVYLAFAIFSHMTTVAWWPIVYDNLASGERGRFFGKMRISWQIAAVLYLLFISFYFGKEASFFHFQTIFAVGAILGLLRTFPTQGLPEVPPEKPKANYSLLHHTLEPLRHSRFRKSLLYLASFTFGQTLISPFFPLFMKRGLFLADSATMLHSQVAPLLGSIFSVFLWGYLADRFGNRPIYRIGNFGVFACYAAWLIVQPSLPTTYLLIPILMLGLGMAFAAFDLATIRDVMGALPKEKAPLYLAAFSVVTGLSGALGPIVGGHLIDLFEKRAFSVGSLVFDNYRIVTIFSAILVFISARFLRGLEERGERPTAEVLGLLFARPIRTTLNLFQWSRSLAEEDRVDAAQALGETRSVAAAPELIESLQDPSFEVRQEAVWALGRQKNSAAVAPLIEALRDPSYNLQYHAAWALGELGSVEAIEELSRQLANPDHQVRGNCAIALGKIGTSRAKEALLERIKVEEDDFAFSSIAWALSHLGVEAPIMKILERAAGTPEAPHRERLLITLGMMFWRSGDFYHIFRSERKGFGWEAPRHLRLAARYPRERVTNLSVREQIRRIEKMYSERDFDSLVSEVSGLVRTLLRETPSPSLERKLEVAEFLKNSHGCIEPWEKGVLAVGVALWALESLPDKGNEKGTSRG